MRRDLVMVALLVGGAALLQPSTSGAADGGNTARLAREVIVRGSTGLSAALRIATRPAWSDGAARNVAIVVDVTPYTARWGDDLADALFDVEVAAQKDEGGAGWQIAALGQPLGPRVSQASLLATQFGDVLGEPTDESSTVRALGRTLRSLGGRDAVVVYLADWRFEDDHGLESLLASLRTAGHAFSVVGSEAAFGRGWIDGFAGPAGALDRSGPYLPGIGRNPFGDGTHDEPWHGGDTAYPHVPWRFGEPRWDTEFAPERMPAPWRRGRDGAREDLRERLRGGAALVNGSGPSRHPLPSAWGPYGLMRLAAETGGHYVLWSWNPDGRSTLRYDYARCNLLQPDLRSRDALRGDLPGRALAAATLRAWHAASARDVATVTVTPPLSRNLRSAREMLEANVTDGPRWAWAEPSERDRFVRRQETAMRKLDAAIADLDGAVDQAPDAPDDIDLRHLADAHLLAHTLRAQRFGIGEAVAAAREIPDDAWDGDHRVLVTLRPETFIERGSEPERVTPGFEPRAEEEIGDRLVAERRRLLERYRGTPHGETAARNEVVGYRPTRAELGDPSRFDAGRNPADSSGTPPSPTEPRGGPGGGSGGSGGPATGR